MKEPMRPKYTADSRTREVWKFIQNLYFKPKNLKQNIQNGGHEKSEIDEIDKFSGVSGPQAKTACKQDRDAVDSNKIKQPSNNHQTTGEYHENQKRRQNIYRG